jgi:hypothetical protein
MFSLKQNKTNQCGSIMMLIIIFTSLFIGIMGAILSLFVYQSRLSRKLEAKETAMQIAEAGINYYRWHLAHAEEDYADGTGDFCDHDNPCGPYEHDYYDPLGGKIGVFQLYITPPPVGSTIVTIKSTGWVEGRENQTRIVEVKYGIPSLSQYAIIADNFIRLGAGTTTYGPLHSNSGIRFDGLAYNLVTSTQADFNDPDHGGGSEFGVHTHVNAPPESGIDNTFRPLEAPPNTVPNRADVFVAGRDFPVPLKDFNGISGAISNLLDEAEDDVDCDIQNQGCVLKDSKASGWQIELLGDGTFRYRKVNSTGSCDTTPMGDVNSAGSWTTISLPDRGIIFVKDNTWVSGIINNNRVTVVAAEAPIASGNAKIWINNDLLYTNKDGRDSIGLIAQDDISIGLFSEDDLEIDAALISQNGRIGREYYPSDCEPTNTYYLRDTITIYGSLATNQRYGFSWICGVDYCSGYEIRNLTYDNNLTFGPPPSFPTTGEYTFISWEEKIAGE